MSKYTRFIPPILPPGNVLAVPMPDLHKGEPPGNTVSGQLVGWKNENGRLTTLGTTTSVSPEVRGDTLEIASIGKPTGTSHKVMKVPSAASGGRPDDASDSSRAIYACPKCSGPVRRVRRRFIDRLVSLITPVRRYRCRSVGWGCDWEGNLRVHSDMPHCSKVVSLAKLKNSILELFRIYRT